MMETDQTKRSTGEPLIRPKSDRVIAGVAVSIARRLSIPTWLVRLVFVILAFSGGVGFVAYAAGWLLIPAEGTSRAAAGQLFDRIDGPRAWIGVGLVTLAVLVALESTNLIDADLALAAILIIFGVLLYRGDLGLGSTSNEENTMSDTSSPDVGTTAVLKTQAGEGSAQPPAPPPQPPVPAAASAPPAPPAPRQRSILGRLTIAAGFITLGIMGFLDVADIADVRARHYFGTAVLVVGLGLLVGSFVGRARGLILLGVVLIPPLLVSPIGDFDFENTTARYAPSTVAEIQGTYSGDVGEMVIDLSNVDFAGESAELTADLTFGHIEIIVPDDVAVQAVGTVAIGESRVLDRVQAGIGELTARASTTGDNGAVTIDAEIGIGQIEIYVEGDSQNVESNGFEFNVGEGGAVDFDINTVADLSESYDIGAGEATFDFSDLELTEDASVAINADIGTVTIIPPDATVTRVLASVDFGDITLPNGEAFSGIDPSTDYLSEPGSRSVQTDPVLTIDVEVGAGEITVEEMR